MTLATFVRVHPGLLGDPAVCSSRRLPVPFDLADELRRTFDAVASRPARRMGARRSVGHDRRTRHQPRIAVQSGSERSGDAPPLAWPEVPATEPMPLCLDADTESATTVKDMSVYAVSFTYEDRVDRRPSETLSPNAGARRHFV